MSSTNEFKNREKNSHELYWNDLNKMKFLGLLSASSLVLRTCFHPLAVIKTRLQTQEKHSKLTTFQLGKQIFLNEKIRFGFYRGYSISLCALLFEPVFMVTLETTRSYLENRRPNSISLSQWNTLTSLSSAGTAALIQQTFLVPIDVLTQRVMVTRSCDGIRINDIMRDIYYRSGDGLRGFYKGYLITLSTSLPFNSIIWTLYWKVQHRLEKWIPIKYDRTISPLSATIAALLTSLLTQPIDVLKTRLQVSATRHSLWKTFLILMNKRGFGDLFCGSLPRACIVVPNSVLMMSLYETIKRASVKK
ncbi:unnamed protein product [Adineta ricciae]|uniref:Uncharacterized protein n=2 Tax=Adineta ricciae TaxID=249248 RepID=A0A815TTK0_ADIRI|nr:unnamed protein product [Adineta ricciae]